MSVNLTDSAAAHIKSYLTKEPDAKGFRIGVKTTGCSGYMYVVETAREIRDTDKVFDSQGIQIVIDDDCMIFLDGTTVDFGREGLNEGFRFENPNVEETCGCGESFSLADKLPVIQTN